MSFMHPKIEQPYAYRRHELVEPDWTRLPGWRHITATEWASVQWQRVNCVKNIRGLRALMGDLLTDKGFTLDVAMLADRMQLPLAQVDDLVVVFQSGAYGASASPQAFLGHAPCPEVLV